MTTSPPKKKIKSTSRASHVAASRQRLVERAAPAQTAAQTPAMTRAPSLKVVADTPPLAEQPRMESLERQFAAVVTTLKHTTVRLEQLEERLAALESGSETELAEVVTEPEVDATPEDLGGESA